MPQPVTRFHMQSPFKPDECPIDPITKEICFPRNSTWWSRVAKCEPEQDPCKISKDGMRAPRATPPPAEVRVGGYIENEELSGNCPSGFAQEENGSNPELTVPAGRFVEWVPDLSDHVRVGEARLRLARLARYFLEATLRCRKWNSEVTGSTVCPPTGPFGGVRIGGEGDGGLVPAGVFFKTLVPPIIVLREADISDISEAELDAFGEQVPHVRVVLTDKVFKYVNDEWEETSESAMWQEQGTIIAQSLQALAGDTLSTSIRCRYGNEPQTVSCPPDANGAGPTDHSQTVSAGEVQYNTLFKDGNPVESSISTNVNTLAEQLAAARLQCVYAPESVTLHCPDPPGPDPEVGLSGNTIVTVDGEELARTITGFTLPITYPTGVPTIAQLQAQLEDRAASRLLCIYSNLGAQATCPDDEVETEDLVCDVVEQTLNLIRDLWLDNSFNFEKSDPEPAVVDQQVSITWTKLGVASAEGGDTENTFYGLDRETLDILRSTCGLDTGGEGEGEGEGEGYTCSEYITGTFPANPDLSVDGRVLGGTINLASTFPNKAALDAFVLADDIESIKEQEALQVMASTICVYGNQEVPPMDCPPRDQARDGNYLQEYSISIPSRRICENEFNSPLGVADAQRMAINAALASQMCVFGDVCNDEITVRCDDGSDPNTSLSHDGVAPEGTYCTRSHYLAHKLAYDVAKLGVVCLYGNTEQIVPCDEEDEPGLSAADGNLKLAVSRPGIVEPNTVLSSESVAAADALALALATASRVCLFTQINIVNAFFNEVEGNNPVLLSIALASATGCNRAFEICIGHVGDLRRVQTEPPDASDNLLSYSVNGGAVHAGSSSDSSMGTSDSVGRDLQVVYVPLTFIFGSDRKLSSITAGNVLVTTSEVTNQWPSATHSSGSEYVSNLVIGSIRVIWKKTLEFNAQDKENPTVVWIGEPEVNQMRIDDQYLPDMVEAILAVDGEPYRSLLPVPGFRSDT